MINITDAELDKIIDTIPKSDLSRYLILDKGRYKKYKKYIDKDVMIRYNKSLPFKGVKKKYYANSEMVDTFNEKYREEILSNGNLKEKFILDNIEKFEGYKYELEVTITPEYYEKHKESLEKTLIDFKITCGKDDKYDSLLICYKTSELTIELLDNYPSHIEQEEYLPFMLNPTFTIEMLDYIYEKYLREYCDKNDTYYSWDISPVPRLELFKHCQNKFGMYRKDCPYWEKEIPYEVFEYLRQNHYEFSDEIFKNSDPEVKAKIKELLS